jgi:septum site-determining protein MinD
MVKNRQGGQTKMKKFFALLLTALLLLSCTACTSAKIEDTNGPDNFKLNTITDQNILKLDLPSSGHGYKTGGLLAKTVEFSSKDFSGVVEGRCPLVRAAVAHPELPSLFLLTAPMRLSDGLDEAGMAALLNTARAQFDYILLDAPAGLDAGFRLAVCHADRALVVATSDASSLRDAQRTVGELAHIPQVHLVMNRVQPKLLRQLRTTIDDAMDTAGLPLIGVVPEDKQVILTANQGRPLILSGRRGAANAYLNIAKRLEGQRVPIMRIR